MAEDPDIVVIGGGIAGLVSATFAARSGASVLVLERHSFGGRARTSPVGPFRFNQGGHALVLRGELMGALRDLGIAVPGGPPSLDLGVLVEGRRHPFPVNPRTLATTGALGARSRVALGLFLQRLRLGWSGHRDGQTVDEWLADRRLPPDAAALVHVLIRMSTYANAPAQLDAGAAAGQLRRAISGVRYLDGGWQTIVDRLTDAAWTAGARLVDHAPVIQLEHSAGGWTVVTANGEHRASSVVLAAASPTTTARLLELEPQELGTPGPACRAGCLDLGLAARAREAVLFSADQPRYLSTHMPPARLGPEGSVVVHAMRYLAPDEHLAPDDGRSALWAHAWAAGVGDGDAAVLESRYLHDMVASHGMPLADRAGLRGRPGVALASRPGAFLAGDWVGDEGMLADASAASGRLAARLAVEHAALAWTRDERGSRLSA